MTSRPAPTRADVLVTALDLRDRLDAGEPVVLLDVRWVLGDPHGREHHLAGHLPGAVFVDLHHELAGEPGPAVGRHPLPELADLQAAARRWGVRSGAGVVAYDDSGSMAAARAWWLLRWAGFTDVRILDGGLGAWVRAGGALETGDVAPAVGDVVLDAGHLPVLDADGAAALAVSGVLLDARAGERYRGEVEPIDPRAGHVPGAVSAPTAENLTGAGEFRSSDELRARFAALGADGADVGVYCGSGVTAAHEVAALAVAGVDAALYVGSWSQWSSDPDRPVATVEPDPVLAMMAADTASAALGVELVEHGPGWARTRLTVRADMVNGHGIVHGGIVFTLADTAFACACNSWGPPAVAAGCEITFVAAGHRGDVLTATARVRTRFGRRGIYDVTVTRGDDEVVAELRGHSHQLAPRPTAPPA